MALITDPDNLNQGTEIVIDEIGKTIQLLVAGNLSTDGVTGQCVYSFLKEEWKDDATLIPYGFPMEAITPEQFEFLDGWAPKDATTRNLIRTAGWAERNTSGDIIKMFAGIISLGTLGGSDQPYYDNDGTVTNFTYTGPINEAIQIVDDPNGDGNYADGYDRRSTLELYAREQAKIYASSDLAAIGVTTMTYQAYRFPLSNSDDTKVTESDVTVDAYDIDITILDNVDRGAWANSTVYAAGDFVSDGGRFYSTAAGGTSNGTGVGDDTGVTDWTAYAGERDIGGTYYAFGVIIDGDATADASNHAANEIYMHVQSALRKATDIDADADSQTGQLCPEILEYVGDTLKTKYITNPQGGGGGVYIDNFDTNDTNSITFRDNSNTERQFPFVSAGTINFNANLQSDATSKYWMFFDHTIRDTVSDLAISGVSGSTASLDSAGGNLPTLAQNDYIRIAGSADEGNNGIWQITDASPSSTQADATKVEGETPSNESAFSATIDQDPYGSADALLVDDNGGTDINGTVSAASSVAFDFDYDGNVQGGRTAATDADVVLVAIGTDGAQFVQATGTITRTTGLAFTLTAPLERNYLNA